MIGWSGVELSGTLLAGALAVALALPALPAVAHDVPERPASAGDRIGTLVERAIREDGPFFTAEERTVIERACGYPAGSWDGFEANIQDGVFICRDGRRVDSSEVRAVMRAAGPRIGARVSRAMSSPEIRAAIAEVTREATAEALRGIDRAAIAQRAAAEAQAAAAEAMANVDHAAIAREAQQAAAEAMEEARRAVAEAERERARRR